MKQAVILAEEVFLSQTEQERKDNLLWMIKDVQTPLPQKAAPGGGR